MSTTPKMERVDGGADEYECQNCGTVWTFAQLKDIPDLGERIAAGEEVPAGECPELNCGALCHPVESTTTFTMVTLDLGTHAARVTVVEATSPQKATLPDNDGGNAYIVCAVFAGRLTPLLVEDQR